MATALASARTRPACSGRSPRSAAARRVAERVPARLMRADAQDRWPQFLEWLDAEFSWQADVAEEADAAVGEWLRFRLKPRVVADEFFYTLTRFDLDKSIPNKGLISYDPVKADAVMRPSTTFNEIIATLP